MFYVEQRDDSKYHPYSLPINIHFKSLSQETSNQQIRFVIIMIEFVFSRFKSIPLGPLVGFSGTQLKGKKPIFFERFSEL